MKRVGMNYETAIDSSDPEHIHFDAILDTIDQSTRLIYLLFGTVYKKLIFWGATGLKWEDPRAPPLLHTLKP